MNRISRLACSGLLIFLAGCSALPAFDSDWINRILYTPTTTPAKTAISTPHPAQTIESSTTQPEPPESQPAILRIWLPEQFDPTANNTAAALLKQRLASF